MSDGFLGRWSRRKEAVRKGEVVAPEPDREVRDEAPPPQPSPGGGGSNTSAVVPPGMDGSGAVVPPPPLEEGWGEGAAAPEPAPTLEDTHSLTPDSDFTRFARPDVAPEVKNAAFRKLFSDPHFNVMDGLDVYIDDYNKPDPLPPEMLRKMASAKFLNLFDDEDEKDGTDEAAPPPAREVADEPAAENVAQSGTPTDPALPSAKDHADPDLRLQQDDAPGPAGPGAGPG